MSRRSASALTIAAVLLGSRLPAASRQTASQDVRQAGQEHFARVCQRCHGAQGRGDSAPRLVPFARDVEEVLGIVREGVGQMPPISTREVSDDAVAQIVEYLKSLAP